MIQELKAKAAEHWQTYLPTMWATLVSEDRVDEALTKAATEAESQIRALMENGARLDEAEEIVLPQLIYLPPETDGLDEELRVELAQKEEEYQALEHEVMMLDPDRQETFIPQARVH